MIFDPIFIYSGETGAGKSESFKLAIKELIAVSKSKRKEDKVSVRLEKALCILEAFGHAKTVQNENASRFGKCVEVQFNTRGRMSGAKILDYLLEKPRSSTVPFGERGFHVFYYLLAGASTHEKADLFLQDPSRYKILSASKNHRLASIDDASQYAELRLALKTCGFKEKYQDQIFQLLASILHLGNLEFDKAEARDEAAVVRNVEELDLVADLLGLRPRNLENALVYKTKLIKKEVCSMFLDEEEAAVQRDELIQTLYSLLFTYISDTLNKKLNDDEHQNYISLVDMFGLENLKENRFHQMLYNFTAERMIAFVNQSIFDSQISKYNEENLPFPQISYADNSKILEVYIGDPSGVLTMINEESRARKRSKMSVFIENLNAGN
jgi:chitin synthase